MVILINMLILAVIAVLVAIPFVAIFYHSWQEHHPKAPPH